MSQTTKELTELMEQLPETVQKQIYNYAQGEARKFGLSTNDTSASTRPGSFLEIAEQRGIVGMIKDGPEDLSTNPEHFEGFGQ